MSHPNNTSKTGISVDFSDELSKNLTIHKNVKQEIIITTEDKIKLVLIKSKEILTSQRDWWTPCGLFISVITTLITSNFEDSLGLTKELWHALFLVLAIVSGGWLVRATYTFFKTSGQNDLDSIIEQIKLKEQAE
jgi:hypothetical protein